jgi:hypothetical protein
VAARAVSRVGRALLPWALGLSVLSCVVFAVLIAMPCCGWRTCCGGARVDSTRTDVASIRSAALMFVSENPAGPCPTVDELIDDGHVDASRRILDAWDEPFVVECAEDEVRVISAGPDGELGTEDDISD